MRAPLLQLLQGAVEIDQHDDAGLRRDAGKGDEADGDGDREIEVHRPHQPEAARERERHRKHDDQRLRHSAEIQIEQKEDNEDGDGDDDLEPRLGPLEIFELPAPGRVIARREAHLLRHGLLRVGDVAAEIAVAEIDVDVDRKLRVLGADA